MQAVVTSCVARCGASGLIVVPALANVSFASTFNAMPPSTQVPAINIRPGSGSAMPGNSAAVPAALSRTALSAARDASWRWASMPK